MMKMRVLFGFALISATACGFAQTHKLADDAVDYRIAGAPLPVAPADKQIAAALKQVSPDQIKANITHLVSFNNRSTISSTETDLKPGTGVLAAADWIKAQYESYSQACGGCMQVQFDEFTQQVEPGFNGSKPRITKPTLLRNVYAILKGTDPVASKRIYLVTGHYDTRETDVMNTYLLYCRFQKMRGGFTEAEYDSEIALVKDTLAGLAVNATEPHWQEYLAAWTA